MKTQSLVSVCIFFTLLGEASHVSASSPHPFHISTAELEFNRETGLCEVSLKLHSTDLEKALSNESGKRVNLEKENAKEQITKYLNEHFVLYDSGSSDESEPDKKAQKKTRSSIKFVGKEFKSSWLWLYFEMKPPAEVSELKMQNTLLLETTADQINIVSVRYDGKRSGLRFDRKKPRLDFKADWLK